MKCWIESQNCMFLYTNMLVQWLLIGYWFNGY